MARRSRASFDIVARDRTKQGFDSASKRARQSSEKIATAFRAATSALAVFGAARTVRGVIRSTAEISEMADVADISSERIQELTKAFSDMAGVSESISRGGLRRFNRRLDLAREGTGAAVDTLDRLNINLNQGTEPALNAVIRRLQEMSKTQSITGEASQLFGEDAGPKMAAAIRQGEDALRAQIRQLREHGRILNDETVEGAREANDRLNALSDRLSTQFARRIAENADAIESLATGLTNVADVVLDASEGITTFGRALGFMAGRIVAGPIPTLSDMKDRLSDLKDERRDLKEQFEGNEDMEIFQSRMQEINREIRSLQGRIGLTENRFSSAGVAANDAGDSVRTLADEFSILSNAIPEFAQPTQDIGTLTQEIERLNGAVDSRVTELLSEGVEDIRDAANPGRAELRQFRDQVELLNRAVEDGILSGDESQSLKNSLVADLSDAATGVRTLQGEMQALEEAANSTGRGRGELSRVRDSLQPDSERIKQQFQRRREIVRSNLSKESAERRELLQQINQQEAEQLSQNEKRLQRIQLSERQETLRGVEGVFGNLSQLMESAGKEQTTIAKRMAQAQAIANAATAITNALAVPPPPVGFALAGTMAATTAAQIARIEGAQFARGGPVYGPGTSTSDSIPARLSNGENVLSANDVRNLGGQSAVEALKRDASRQRSLSSGGNAGAGGGISVTNVFNVEANDTGGSVEQQLAQLAPMIEQISRQSVLQAIEDGGPLARGVGRRAS